MPDAADTRTVKRKNHQNSDRRARPSNAAYFEKQVLMDSPNVIFSLPIQVDWNNMGVTVSDIDRAQFIQVGCPMLEFSG
jgi:hypothetical protein